MNKEMLSLGIDTSNYKTSVAITSPDGEILFNFQRFLKVKEGERGLRQSEALFQHVQILPLALEKAMSDESVRKRIGAVSVSTKPRPVENSYMPVFTVGEAMGKAVSAALGVPLYNFSHQEGHIEAVKHYSVMAGEKRLICFHFSGGTTEALLVDEDGGSFEIVGGSKDLAYGQVLDRVGVSLGYGFPCGQEIDRLALEFPDTEVSATEGSYLEESAADGADRDARSSRAVSGEVGVGVTNGHGRNLLTAVKVREGFVNLSGIETQCQRLVGKCSETELAACLMEELSRSVFQMTSFLAEKYHINNFLYAGGVSCSRYMRGYLSKTLPAHIKTAFGEPALSSDNAVGVSLLGGKKIWL